MNNGGLFAGVKGLGYAYVVGHFRYFTNGTSNPATIDGPAARWVTSITYSATGVQTIVFNAGFNFAQTPVFACSASGAALASSFDATQIGAYNATTRTLVLQQRQNTTGYAAAADPGSFVNVVILAQDTQGK